MARSGGEILLRSSPQETRNVKTLLLLAVKLAVISVHAQDAPLRVELLWPEGAPGAVGNQYEDWPSIMIYLPEAEKATGPGMDVLVGPLQGKWIG